MAHVARVAETVIVTNVAARFDLRMEPGQIYRLCGNVDAWFTTGHFEDVLGAVGPQADGSVYLPAKTYFDLLANNSDDGWVAVIKNADTPVEFFMNLTLLEGGT